MFKLISFVLVFTFAATVSGQFSQITDFLNNITINDVSNILRQLPVPHPLIFDGLPLSRNDVTFFLYTRQNPDIPEILKRSSTRFGSLDPQNEVKFIIHGWLESANRTYYRGFIDAYLRKGPFNVIAVDWARPAMNEYSISARNTKTSGRELGDFIIRLNKSLGIPFEQFHILGHSLGAHLAGFAGKRIISRTGRKVGRISALDAAGPLYETPIPVDRNNRLNRNDADFVDCIHTDGGIFGMVQDIGHADFYPNGGVPRQPGCSLINIRQLSSRVIIDDMFCSHSRSYELFTESINSNNFKATECNSYDNYRAGLCTGRPVVIMGEEADPTTRGKFYLSTNAATPFARL